jgi:hypothetical protein
MQDPPEDLPADYEDEPEPEMQVPESPHPSEFPYPDRDVARERWAERGLIYPPDRNAGSSDNDLYNLLREMTKPEVRGSIDHFLYHNSPTPKATHRLITFVRAVLDTALAGSYLRDQRDYDKLYDAFQILKCETPLGLTCYDVDESYNHIMNMVELHFVNTLLKARGGFIVKRVATTTMENINADAGLGVAQQEPSLLNRIRMH